jgi:hypothetical protein
MNQREIESLSKLPSSCLKQQIEFTMRSHYPNHPDHKLNVVKAYEIALMREGKLKP